MSDEQRVSLWGGRFSGGPAEALAELAKWNVGALVVADEEHPVSGLLSERDIVRHLARDGVDVLTRPVAEVMVHQVATCLRGTSTGELMALMTNQRTRHVPVMEEGRLIGVVSIGDVVKALVDELASEAAHLAEYIRTGQ